MKRVRTIERNVFVYPGQAVGAQWVTRINLRHTELNDLQTAGLNPGWTEVRLDDGTEGYVESAKLEDAPVPALAPVIVRQQVISWPIVAIMAVVVALLAAGLIYLATRPVQVQTIEKTVKETVTIKETVVVEKIVSPTPAATQTPLPSPTAKPTNTPVPTAKPTEPPASPTPIWTPPARPTYVPVPSAGPALPSGGADRPTNCPTDGAVQDVFGFVSKGVKPVFTGEGVPWDWCKWNWQAYGVGTLEFDLLADWEATVTRNDNIVAVYNGPVHLKVKGFTLRYRPAYNTSETQWVNDACTLLEREDAFGHRRVPLYHTVSGNVPCASFAHPMGQSPQTSVASSSGSGPTDSAFSWNSKCFDKQWLNANIGGPVDYWIIPDWDGGAARFLTKPKPGVAGPMFSLRYPDFGKLVVWIGGAVEITSVNANQLNGKTFDEASFHCR